LIIGLTHGAPGYEHELRASMRRHATGAPLSYHLVQQFDWPLETVLSAPAFPLHDRHAIVTMAQAIPFTAFGRRCIAEMEEN
jgi:hypothetical protein